MTESPKQTSVSPVRVAQVVDDFTHANFGVTSALEQLAFNTARAGVESEIYHASRGERASQPNVHNCRPDRFLGRLGFSSELVRRLWLDASRFDVIHVHGLWNVQTLVGLGVGRILDVPLVLTPHNMIGGWLWRRSLTKRIKKEAFFRAFKPCFQAATVVHALSKEEAQTLKEFFPKAQIVVIPNAVDLSRPRVSDELPGENFVYLGRLDPAKGLTTLVDAFALVANRVGARLLLAGKESHAGFEQSLRKRVQAAGIADRVDFLGRVDGDAKWNLLASARAGFLPSYSEGMSMSALETFAAHTPLVATRSAGCPEVEEYGGLITELTAESLAEAMLQVDRWTDAERLRRGAAMRRLAEERFSWTTVAEQYADLYRSLKRGQL